MIFPILRSRPALDVGTPVSRASFCFACDIPKALFHEKLSPGIGVEFFAIIISICFDAKIRKKIQK